MTFYLFHSFYLLQFYVAFSPAGNTHGGSQIIKTMEKLKQDTRNLKIITVNIAILKYHLK